MNKIIPFLILIVMITSCYKNTGCNKNYIGNFKIDTSKITNLAIKKYVQDKRLDTIKLVSTEDGNYHFHGENYLLKNHNGKWFTKSNNIEGDCTGYIKQKNLNREFPRIAFDIFVKINGETYILPFRKLENQ